MSHKHQDVKALADKLSDHAAEHGLMVSHGGMFGMQVDVYDPASGTIIVACQPEISDRGQKKIMLKPEEVLQKVKDARKSKGLNEDGSKRDDGNAKREGGNEGDRRHLGGEHPEGSGLKGVGEHDGGVLGRDSLGQSYGTGEGGQRSRTHGEGEPNHHLGARSPAEARSDGHYRDGRVGASGVGGGPGSGAPFPGASNVAREGLLREEREADPAVDEGQVEGREARGDLVVERREPRDRSAEFQADRNGDRDA